MPWPRGEAVRRRVEVATALALAVAAIAATACGSRPPPPGVDAIRVALPSEPSSLDPHRSNEAVSYCINSNLYESLVRIDGQLNIAPGLAARWLNPDDTTWTFDLAPGVRFHDGRALTADDVAYSLLRAQTDPVSEWKPDLAAVQSVEAVARDRVVVRTNQPLATLLRNLVGISIVPRPAAGEDDLEHRPMGTGPYRLESRDPGTGTVRLVSWAGYRGPPGPVRTITFRTIAQEDRRARAYLDGEVDLVIDVPQSALDMMRTVRDTRILTAPGFRQVYLGFDSGRARTPYAATRANPFRDRRVREAVSRAVPRDRLVAQALGGLGSEASQLAAPGVFGYRPGIRPPPYDPAAARKLLTEAGYPRGFAVVLDAPRGVYAADAALAAFLAHSLGEVGLSVTVHGLDKVRFFAKLRAQDTSLFLLSWNCLTGDVQEVFDFLLHSPNRARGYGSDNAGRYANAAFDTLAEEAGREMDPSTRIERLRAATELAMADVPCVPLYVQTYAYAVRSPFRWTPRPDKAVRAAEIQIER